MIVHQTRGVTEPPIAIDHMAEQSQKVRAVSIIADDGLASIAPTRDMVDSAGKFKTQQTSHGPNV